MYVEAKVIGSFFCPSTQRHYRRLILLLALLHVAVVRPSSSRNILLARITQMTMDSLFLGYNYHYSDRFDDWLLS
jgi:hypothetical protein